MKSRRKTNATKKLFLIALASSLILGCGKDNKSIAPPETPLTPIGLQPASNLLLPYDASFEEVEMVERRTNPSIRIPSTNNFRVTGGDRRQGEIDISTIASFEGKKSLRLLQGEKQSLIIPTSSRREKSPLSLQSGSRYRFTAFVRFPRGTRRRPSGMGRILLQNDTDRTGEVFQSLTVKESRDNWFEVSADFEIPTLVNNGKLVLQIDGSNDLLIDDLKFIKLR